MYMYAAATTVTRMATVHSLDMLEYGDNLGYDLAPDVRSTYM